ncbi:MAG TPA: hypothetical protein VIH86_07650 [Puia sp.]
MRLSKARKKFVNEEIDAEDFKMIKMECEQERTSLESEFISLNFVSEPIEKLLNQVFANMPQLDILYDRGPISDQRKIISSIFPGKLIFDGNEYRTIRTNEVVSLICSVGKAFSEIEKEKKDDFSQMSARVSPQRLELWTR